MAEKKEKSVVVEKQSDDTVDVDAFVLRKAKILNQKKGRKYENALERVITNNRKGGK